jgi:hypothetical protein
LCALVWTLTPLLLSSTRVLIAPTRFYIYLESLMQHTSMHAARSKADTAGTAMIATLTGDLARTAGPTDGLAEAK